MNFCTSDYQMKLKVQLYLLDFCKILVGDSHPLITGDLSILTGISTFEYVGSCQYLHFLLQSRE